MAMNVFGWLSRYPPSFWFGRAVSDVRSKLAPMRSLNGQHCLVAAEPPLVEAAFDQIMADVDVPRAIETRLRPHFVSAYRSGNPGRIIEVLKAVFDGIEWGEGYFDAWRMRFISRGAFPHAWRRAKTLLVDAPPPPSDIGSASQYLRMDDMRKLLDHLGTMPAPAQSADLKDLLRATGATGAVIKAALPRYEYALIDFPARRQRQKCAMLAHTISMRAGALRDRHERMRPYKRLQSHPQRQQLRPTNSDCPVETAYGEKYMAGEIRGEPPFFPGDRTRLAFE